MSYTELCLHANEARAYLDGDLEPRKRGRRKRPPLPRELPERAPEPPKTPEQLAQEERELDEWWFSGAQVDAETKRRLREADVAVDRELAGLDD